MEHLMPRPRELAEINRTGHILEADIRCRATLFTNEIAATADSQTKVQHGRATVAMAWLLQMRPITLNPFSEVQLIARQQPSAQGCR